MAKLQSLLRVLKSIAHDTLEKENLRPDGKRLPQSRPRKTTEDGRGVILSVQPESSKIYKNL